MIWILIVGCILLALVLLYFGFGYIFLAKFFRRSKKPLKFKDNLGEKDDFSPDLDWLTSPDKEDLTYPWRKKLQRARLIPYHGSHKYLICIHGFKGSFGAHSRMNKALANALKANALLLVLRGDKESDWSYCSLGNKECEDLLRWIDFIKKRDPEARFYIWGVSMGAAISIFASDHYGPEVLGVVADSGFGNLQEQMDDLFRARLHGLAPFFEFPVKLAYQSHFLVPMDQHTDAALKHTHTPFFFIHGEKDTFVLPKNFHHNLELDPSPSWFIKDCPHAVGDVVDKDEYFDKVSRFFLGLKD